MKIAIAAAALAVALWGLFQLVSSGEDADGVPVPASTPGASASTPAPMQAPMQASEDGETPEAPGPEPTPAAAPAPGAQEEPGAGSVEDPPAAPAADEPAGASDEPVAPASPGGEAQVREVPLGAEDGSVEYVEGTIRSLVYRHERQWAEFQAEGEPSPPVPGARLVQDGRIRFWESPEGTRAFDAIQRARAEDASRKYSPLYFRNPSRQGTPRMLPGGITVQFEADWQEATIGAFAARNGLTGGKPHPIGRNWYTFASPAGEASLELATRIQATGEVVLAKANWAERHALK